VSAFCISSFVLDIRDRKIRLKKFHENGDINGLTIEDVINNAVINKCVTDPEEYKKFLKTLDSKNVQQKREEKIDKLFES
jgi:AICAR transformylase/IMP cyclohydrolase PurH